MNFQESTQTCFKKYAQFSERASRSEFWFFALFALIGSLITWVIDTMMFGYPSEDWGPVSIIFQIVIFIPYLAVGARRLHDIGKTGWLQLISLTIIGLIPLIIWFATVGTNKKNNYGNPIKLKK